MRFWDGKKGAIGEVPIPRINNSAEPRETNAFLGERGWGFSRAGGMRRRTGVRGGGVAEVSAVRGLVIRMAFRPRV